MEYMDACELQAVCEVRTFSLFRFDLRKPNVSLLSSERVCESTDETVTSVFTLFFGLGPTVAFFGL